MNSEEKITIGFKEQTGFRISEGDLTTGKVVVNGIEITSVEDWEKVTKSLIKLQNNWNELKKWAEKEIRQSGSKYDRWGYEECLDKMQELENNNDNNT